MMIRYSKISPQGSDGKFYDEEVKYYNVTEARDSMWQWHQLSRRQVCTSLQTDNHTSTHHSVFYRLDGLPAAQPTVSKH